MLVASVFLFLLACCLWQQCAVGRDIAVIVSVTHYHVEVVGFFADQFRRLNMDVHLWTQHHRSTATNEPFLRPMVDAVVHIENRTEARVPESVKVVVYITMNVHVEMRALCKYNNLHEALFAVAEHAIVVNHHSKATLEAQSVCRPPKCTLFHLSQHVHEAAFSFANKTASEYQAVAAIPVFVPAVDHHFSLTALNISATTRLLVAQGNINPFRRRYNDLIRCVGQLRSQGVDVKLALVGNVDEAVSIPNDLASSVAVLSGLPYPQFYAVLQKADFLVSFCGTKLRYDKERSSSSIPAAVMNGVPIVIPKGLISKYRCLDSSASYQAMAREDDCSSLRVALTKNSEEMRVLREETRRCQRQWIEEASDVLRGVLARNASRSLLPDYSRCAALIK